MSNNSDNIEAGRDNQRSAFSVAKAQAKLPARLTKRQQFLDIAAHNKKFVTSGFILQCGARFDEKRESKFGYTASKRVGGAVERNKVKRKLRELVRLVLAKKLSKQRDYVLVGRKSAIQKPFTQLVKDAEKLLAKQNLN